MTKNIDIFICHTYSNFFYSLKIKESLNTGNDCFFIIEGFEFPGKNNNCIKYVHIMKDERNNVDDDKVLDYLLKFYDNYNSLNIYLSDIKWKLNNYIFFKLKRLPRIAFYTFSDGALTIYAPKVNILDFIKMVMKCILSLRYFHIGYFPFLGYYDGRERKEICGLVCPKLFSIASMHPIGKPINIEINCEHLVNLNKNMSLFVETSYLLKNVSEKNYNEWFLKVYKFMTRDFNGRILYKPHHFSEVTLTKENKELFGLKYIDSSTNCEILISRFGVTTIYAIDSSTMYTAKLIFGNKIRVVCLIDDFYFKHERLKCLGKFERELFHKFQIETPFLSLN